MIKKAAIITLLFEAIFIGLILNLYPEVHKLSVITSNPVSISSNVDPFQNAEDTEISLQLMFDYQEYQYDFINCHLDIEDQVSHINLHNEEIAEYYYNKNLEFLTEMDISSYDSIYIAKYSPFVNISFTQAQYMQEYDDIYALDNSESIIEASLIFGHLELDIETSYLTTPQADYSLNDAFSDMGIIGSYSGSNVTIGIIDMALPYRVDDYSNGWNNFDPDVHFLYGEDETEYWFSIIENYTQYSSEFVNTAFSILAHSYEVASTIKTIAPQATIYFDAIEDVPDILSSLDRLKDVGVNIINMSVAVLNGEITTYTKQVDYYSTNYGITMIGSAGNEEDSNYLVNTLVTGPNSISVGATGVQNKVSFFSCYETVDTDAVKPTLVAPGEQLVDVLSSSPVIYFSQGYFTLPSPTLTGTSFSSPFVVGIVARLMQQKTLLKTHPEAVMALLISSTEPISGQDEPVDDRAGYGLVNYQNAQALLATTFAYSISGTKSDNALLVSEKFGAFGYTHLHFDLAFLSYVYQSGSTFTTYSNSYTVEIVDRENNVIFSEESFDYAPLVHIDIDFTPSTDGLHYIRIRQNGAKTNTYTFRIGLSYDLETSPHTHSYTYDYVYASTARHLAYCICGESILQYHFYDSWGICVCGYEG